MTPAPPPTPPSPFVSAALRLLFGLAANAPWLLRAIRPVVTRVVVCASKSVRDGTAANARGIFPAPINAADLSRFSRDVVGSFYDFVLDVAQFRSASADELRAHLQRTEGLDRYFESRKLKRGAILVTAHMGSFEVGLAALVGAEPKVHVVYKRDPFAAFDTMREELRARLGVNGIAIDDGWNSLMAMRSALERDEVVVLQADRAMPGQRAQNVPFLGGHLALPLGPVTLARIAGSPIVPVFTVRVTPHRFRVHLLPPIWLDVNAPDVDGVDPTLKQIADAIAGFVRAYPEQWLVLSPAFLEDQSRVS